MTKKKAILWSLGVAGAVASTIWLNSKYQIKILTRKKTLIEKIQPLSRKECRRFELDKGTHPRQE